MASSRTWWKVVSGSIRALFTSVPAAGDIVTTLAAELAIGDGVTPMSGLPLAEMAYSIAPEAGVSTVEIDSAGNIVRIMRTDGSVRYANLQHLPASVPLVALGPDVTPLLPTPIPLESGYADVEVDLAGNIIRGITYPDGRTVGVGSGTLTAGSVPLTALTSNVQARLNPNPLPQDRTYVTGTTTRRVWLDRDAPWGDRKAITDGTVDSFNPLVTQGRGVLWSTAAAAFWTPPPHNITYPAVSDSTVGVYGDSLSAAHDQTETALAADLGVTVINQGVPGQASTDIAMRQGGAVVTFSFAGPIPTSATAVACTPVSSSTGVLAFQTGGFTWIGTFAGIAGTLSHSVTAVGALDGWTFTPTASGPGASVPTPIPFTCTGGPGAPAGHNSPNCGAVDQNHTQILALGRNNVPMAQVPNIAADVAGCVAFLKPYSKRYIVVSISNRLDEGIGTVNYAAIVAHNTLMAATYGTAFFNLRRYMIQYFLGEMGLTPTSQDLIDIANDTVPTSLHAGSVPAGGNGTTDLDPLHWSDATYAHVGHVYAALMGSTGTPSGGIAGKGWY